MWYLKYEKRVSSLSRDTSVMQRSCRVYSHMGQGTGKTAYISPIDLLQNITTFVTVACRKDEDIEKTTAFEVSNT